MKTIVFGLATSVLIFAGCATNELQTSTKMTQSVFINPVKKELKTVFVSIRNTSGKRINLNPSITGELIAKGYKIVDDPDAATYVLMANILYCDKKREDNTAGGAIAGGTAGAIVGAGAGGNNTGLALGLIGGSIVGGLAAKSFEDTIFQMQVDIVIREKAKGPVQNISGNAQGQSSVHDSRKSGFANGFGGKLSNTNASGKLNSNMVNAGVQSYSTNYIEHKTMLFSEATKTNLTFEEATPVLEREIANQIVGLF